MALADPPPTIAVLRTSLFVRGLKVMAPIGVHHHEKGRTQPLVIDVEIQVAPVAADQLAKTFDYNLVQLAVTQTIADGHVELVEIFAERVAQRIFGSGTVETLTIRVAKPQALAPHADSAGVELQLAARSKGENRRPAK